jgi:short-subunit dehydrogenase
MNIVITGASSGIGYATAQRFAAEPGNLIFAMARSGDKLEELSGFSR